MWQTLSDLEEAHLTDRPEGAAKAPLHSGLEFSWLPLEARN